MAGRTSTHMPAGTRVGRLVLVTQVGGRWRCTCDCGIKVTVFIRDLVEGSRRSCGCALSPQRRHLLLRRTRLAAIRRSANRVAAAAGKR